MMPNLYPKISRGGSPPLFNHPAVLGFASTRSWMTTNKLKVAIASAAPVVRKAGMATTRPSGTVSTTATSMDAHSGHPHWAEMIAIKKALIPASPNWASDSWPA